MVVVIVDLSKERVYKCLLHDVTEIPAAFNAHGSGFNRVTLLLFLLLQTPQSIVLFTLSWKLQSEKQHVQNINHQKESTWIVRFPSLYFIHSPSSQFNQYNNSASCFDTPKPGQYSRYHALIIQTNERDFMDCKCSALGHKEGYLLIDDYYYQIVFKVLIIIHTLMREGADDCAVNYVYQHLEILETNKLRDKSSSEYST